MYQPRLFGDRKHEMKLRDVVKSVLPMGWFVSSVPKVYACDACYEPLLVISHAASEHPHTKIFHAPSFTIARRAGIPYVMCTLSGNKVGYTVFRNKRRVVFPPVSVAEFFRHTLVKKLLPRKCPRCRKKFAWSFRDNPSVDSAWFIKPSEPKHDSLEFELLHRELAPKEIVCIDIDVVVFDECDRIVALGEGEITNNDSNKSTKITQILAKRVGVHALHIRVSPSGIGKFRILPDGVWVALTAENLSKLKSQGVRNHEEH